jgi:hypothetical protein
MDKLVEMWRGLGLTCLQPARNQIVTVERGRKAYACTPHGTSYGPCCDQAKHVFATVDQSLEEVECPAFPSLLDILDAAKETAREREARYGGGRLHAARRRHDGPSFRMASSFRGPEEFARYYLLEKIVEKLCRYIRSYAEGGHQDSIHDLGVYAFKMEEHDARYRYRR